MLFRYVLGVVDIQRKSLAVIVCAMFAAGPAWASNPATIPSVPTIAAMKALGVASAQYSTVYVKAYSTSVSDAGGGMFSWSPGSTTTANLCTVFAATGVSTGRWIRQDVSSDARKCGADPDGGSNGNDSTIAINACIALFTNCFVPYNAPSLGYVITAGQVVLPSFHSLTGESSSCSIAPTQILVSGISGNAILAGGAGGFYAQGIGLSNVRLSFTSPHTGTVGLKLDNTTGFTASCVRIDSAETGVQVHNSIIVSLQSVTPTGSTVCVSGDDTDGFGLHVADIGVLDCESATAQAIVADRADDWHIHDSIFQGVGTVGSGLGVVSFTNCGANAGTTSCLLLEASHFESTLGASDIKVRVANNSVTTSILSNTFASGGPTTANVDLDGGPIFVAGNGGGVAGPAHTYLFGAASSGWYCANTGTVSSLGAAVNC